MSVATEIRILSNGFLRAEASDFVVFKLFHSVERKTAEIGCNASLEDTMSLIKTVIELYINMLSQE
jgi:signal recognition particle GTPase